MSGTTEEQARQTLCHKTLYAHTPALHGPGNAGPQTVQTKGGPCIVSACMAWRWDYDIRFIRTSKENGPPAPDEGWELHTEGAGGRLWRKRTGGFCGLAEPRIVDVEVQER